MPATELLGQAACLLAAASWAAAVLVFRRSIAAHGAPAVNLVKCLVATLMLALTLLLTGAWRELLVTRAIDLQLLVLSGLIGMTIGDTALFAAVSRIGVHRTLLLQTLAPVFTAVLAALFTGERITTAGMAGGLLILAGVAMVVAPPKGGDGRAAAFGLLAGGIAYAVLAAFGQGTGVVVAKAGMSEMSALVAALLRLAAASVGLVVVIVASGRSARVVAVFQDRKGLRRLLPATVLGTYVAVLLMMAGIALAPAAIAAVLLATTPIFSLVLESVVQRRWPSFRGMAGTALAIAGVTVLSVYG